VIEVWENGNKKGKFYVSDLDKSAKDGIIAMKCEDESKKLNDYFITESHSITTLQYSRPWIERFLDEAKISYTFTVDASDQGVPLSNNTTLGFDAAFNVVTTLLQQTGWYIYFDPNGTAIIGDLNKDVNNPDHTISAADFSTFERELDDDRLRNRAVVWGNSNPTYGDVFVDISVQTPWNYDAQDKRAVVIANGSIYNHSQALELAHKLLNEFTQIKDEKYLLVVNDYNMQLGEIVKVNSAIWNGRGLITSINASASPDGLVYGITLDQHCPRMFTFYSELPPTVSGFYVYTGHTVDGIWRKYSEGSVFSQDSAGLEPNTKVNDLFIKNGTFATVLDDGYLYTRTSENGVWNKYTPPTLRDRQGTEYSFANLRAQACSINYSDNVIAGYNFVPSGTVASGIPASGLSWVLELTGAHTLIKAEQVVISGAAGDGADFSLYDLESTGEYNIVAASGYVPVSGYVPTTVREYNDWGSGFRDICLIGDYGNKNGLPPDSDSLAVGWGYGETTYSTVIAGPRIGYTSDLICDSDQNYWYTGSDGELVKIDTTAETSTSYSFTPPAEWATASSNIGFALRKRTSTTFDIVVMLRDGTPYPDEANLIHYIYTLGGSLVEQSRDNWEEPHWFSWGLVGGNVVVGWWNLGNGERWVKILNLTASTYSDIEVTPSVSSPDTVVSASSQFFSTGDALIHGVVYIKGTNVETFDCGIPGNQDIPTAIEVRAKGYRVAKNGSTTAIGDTLLYSMDIVEESGEQNLVPSLTQLLMGGTTTNTSLKFGYTICGIGVRAGNCSTENKRYGITFGIKWTPFPSLFYSKEANGGNWFTRDDAYFVNNASEIVGHTAGQLGWTANCGYHSQYAKYGGAGFWCSGDGISAGSYEFSEFREVPAFGTSYGWRASLDYFANISSGHPKDDLTRQMIFGTTTFTSPRYLTMAQQWNFDDWDSRMATIESTVVFAGITQHFGVSRNYKIYKFDTSASTDYPKGTILKHTSTYNLGSSISASDDALEQTLGIFEVIKTTKYPTKVDIAHGVPTVIYDIPKDDASPVTEDFWGSVTNEPDSFYTHADTKPVYEARTLNLLNPQAFPTASGTLTAEDYERYVGISNSEGILASEYDLSTPWVNLVTVASGVIASGLITHFETTNFVPEGTYIFYTVSGVKSFFQKNADENFWRDYSSGLPDSPITIIRVDDVI
jgi:hypothetical protein